MSRLFEPIELRSVTLRNRVVVSPMCQYAAAADGCATDWHLVHLGARAVGGAGMVIAEATAVTAEGRISPADLGLWSDAQVQALRPIADFISGQGSVPAVQLAHAGRKASTHSPRVGRGVLGADEGGWTPVAASPIPYPSEDPPPHELSVAEIGGVVDAFAAAARRAAKPSQSAIRMARSMLDS